MFILIKYCNGQLIVLGCYSKEEDAKMMCKILKYSDPDDGLGNEYEVQSTHLNPDKSYFDSYFAFELKD